jgi:hypothetical protein
MPQTIVVSRDCSRLFNQNVPFFGIAEDEISALRSCVPSKLLQESWKSDAGRGRSLTPLEERSLHLSQMVRPKD